MDWEINYDACISVLRGKPLMCRLGDTLTTSVAAVRCRSCESAGAMFEVCAENDPKTLLGGVLGLPWLRPTQQLSLKRPCCAMTLELDSVLEPGVGRGS